MSGYTFVLGACWACGRPFTFSPSRVPSLPVNGSREPICQLCMDRANDRRRAMGLEPYPILPGAYEADGPDDPGAEL